MRAYFFGNSYLSSLQQGLQATHVMAQMFMDYPEDDDDEETILLEWASDYKTIILMNGGNSGQLNELSYFFSKPDNTYPHGSFCESGLSLNNAKTCVGIVLPEKIYAGAKMLRENKSLWNRENRLTLKISGKTLLIGYTDWEMELMNKLNTYKLAA